MHSEHSPMPVQAQAVRPPSIQNCSAPSSAADVGQQRNHVSANADTAAGMTDMQREEAIKRAGLAVVRHMGEWERTGCFAARGDADRARRLMELLIAGRSPQYVAQLERERGLA